MGWSKRVENALIVSLAINIFVSDKVQSAIVFMEIENGFELSLAELPLALASGQMGYSKIWALAQYLQELDLGLKPIIFACF